TYNGDHMSNYALNGSICKTAVRRIVSFVAKNSDEKLKKVLLDIVDTPVSPELLPPTQGGEIAQKTEEKIGPYELHDFFLYHVLKNGFSADKIYRIALQSFAGDYDEQTVYHWLRTFIWRFFTQQFKRSCLPDGVAISEITVSPRGGLAMPSDAVANEWINALEKYRNTTIK
ncbi:MAG: NAD(+) synthase, partial [Clostridia bacterium]|nr:NAD(+) synthase [Clostridia bacterium]